MLQLLTAVLRDCEFSGKITFSYRKKFYLSRKFSVTKFATSQSRETLYTIYFPNLHWKLLSYFFWIIITENLAWKTKTKPNFVDKLCVEITFSGKSVVKLKPETKLCVTIRTLRWVLFLSSENIILYTTAV